MSVTVRKSQIVLIIALDLQNGQAFFKSSLKNNGDSDTVPIGDMDKLG